MFDSSKARYKMVKSTSENRSLYKDKNVTYYSYVNSKFDIIDFRPFLNSTLNSIFYMNNPSVQKYQTPTWFSQLCN